MPRSGVAVPRGDRSRNTDRFGALRRVPDDELARPRSYETGDFPALRSHETGDFPAVRTSDTGDFPALRSHDTSDFPAVRTSDTGDFPALRSHDTSDFAAVRASASGELAAVRSPRPRRRPADRTPVRDNPFDRASAREDMDEANDAFRPADRSRARRAAAAPNSQATRRPRRAPAASHADSAPRERTRPLAAVEGEPRWSDDQDRVTRSDTSDFAALLTAQPAGRRTVTIRGRGAERYEPRRAGADRSRAGRRHEQTGYRPDRMAMWAVLLGVMLILAAVLSAHS